MPTMFGKPIYWHHVGEIDKVRKVFKKKVKKIRGYNVKVYVETNHAFLKSFSDVAMEFFPEMKLVHLIRNPLKVAKSNLNRYKLIRRYHYPYRYRGDDGRYYVKWWCLTGKEKIFEILDCDWECVHRLTDERRLYQILLFQWIEIENRAMKFLDTYKKHSDCYTLSVPKDLNNRNTLKDMFDFFELELKKEYIDLRGRKNKGAKPTVVTEEDKKLLEELVSKLPSTYLQIFKRKPYVDVKCEWMRLLTRS
ncbi:MAG TPA: hypothetical protein ENI42_03725 [Thermoplasmatales archaeon]|nr:hypothetical protein [Thermoplasmatales archaeon]